MKERILLLSILMLFSISSFSQTGNTNTGTGAGNAGAYNTSIGYYAGDLVTSSFNTFLGYYSGKNTNNVLATNNFFGGYNSGLSNTTGASNLFLGSNAGKDNTTGSSNTALGSYSGRGATGSMNTFVGYFSGRNGSGNVMVGGHSGGEATTGNNNTYLGAYTGYYAPGSGNIFIGYYAGYNETGSNRLYIENSNSALPLIYGDFASDKVGINSLPNAGVLSPNTNVTLTVGGMINSTGLLVNGALVSGDLSFWGRSGNYVSALTPADNVGIGVILTEAKNVHGYKLAVNGKIGAKEIQIENNSITWSDFVFDEGYKLLSLEELERYIKLNKHLPEIPTAQEVKENGILLGEMNAKLLQKIEELTLHLIELKKEVETLKNQSNEDK